MKRRTSLAAVPEILRDGRRRERGAQLHQRRLLGGGDHDDGFPHPLLRPRSLRSMNSRTCRPRSPTRAMTLTDASVYFAIIPSRTLFPTPAPAMIPSRCPFPHVSALHRADPQVDGLGDPSPLQRVGGGAEQGMLVPAEGPLPVQRIPHPVYDSSDQPLPDADEHFLPHGVDPAAELDPGDVAYGHQERLPVPEAHDFGPDGLAAPRNDLACLPDGDRESGGLDEQPGDLDDLPVDPERLGPLHGADAGGKVNALHARSSARP